MVCGMACSAAKSKYTMYIYTYINCIRNFVMWCVIMRMHNIIIIIMHAGSYYYITRL